MRVKSVSSYFMFPALILLTLSMLAVTGLLQGCQTSPDQETVATPSAIAGSSLALSVVSTDSCSALKAKLVGGTAADSAAFAAQCVVQVLPDSARPGTQPDSGIRCIWIKQHIDSGEVALIAAFAVENKATCDSLKTTDSVSFAKYCRIPPPPPRPKCDSMLDTLTAMDTVSQHYLGLQLAVGGMCGLPIPPPPPPRGQGQPRPQPQSDTATSH